MKSSAEKRQRSLFLRVIYHPLFYSSLLLHGLIFAIPGSPEPEVPPELEEEPQEIQITMLPPVIEPEPEINLEDLPETEAPPPPPQQIVQAQPRPEPVAPPQDQAPPSTQEVEPDVVAAGSGINSETTFDPSAFRNTFNAQLTDIPGYVPIRLTPDAPVWEDSSLFYESSGGSETVLRRGILDAPALLNDIRPENVLPNRSGADSSDSTLTGKIVHLGASFAEGVTLSPAGEYGGGPVYEVLSPEGQTIMFLNVVPSSTRASTILIKWAFDPNNPVPPDSPVGAS